MKSFQSSEWLRIHKHTFTDKGSVGLLVEKTSGAYCIATNASWPPPTSSSKTWVLYP